MSASAAGSTPVRSAYERAVRPAEVPAALRRTPDPTVLGPRKSVVRTAWGALGDEQRRAEARVLEWNDRHAGADIYILGAAPQLNHLTPAMKEAIAAGVSIGVNRTFYSLPIRYMLSAYPGELLLATLNMPEERLFHMELADRRPVFERATTVGRMLHAPGIRLPRRFSLPVPRLYTRRNVILGATHLALILGAKRIIYVGVEQSSMAYFWQYDPAIRVRLIEDLQAISGDELAHFWDSEAERAKYFESQYALAGTPAVVSRATAFYDDLSDVFRQYFAMLAEYGVTVYATTADSVIYRAGARLVPLDLWFSEYA